MTSSKRPTRSFDYVIADVFTNVPFGGNQLAVFPDAAGMSEQTMQKIAREFNFPESTFVLPPSSPRHAARVRIFTPKRELPFAGHPTIGTAAVLAHLERLRFFSNQKTVVFEEAMGDVSIEIGTISSRMVYTELMLSMGVQQPQCHPSRHDLAAALSLPASDVLDAWYAAVGVPFSFVRLASAAAVDKAVLDQRAWLEKISSSWAPQLFLFAGDYSPSGTVHARMFAPAFGIDEDPATGSAVLALVGVLGRRVVDEQGEFTMVIHQGVAMGRPSVMKATAEKKAGEVTRLRVGGDTVIVARGIMDVGQ